MEHLLYRVPVWCAVAVLLFCTFTPGALAVTIEQLGTDEVYKDFVVGPGKVELELMPGESKTVAIKVTNRMGEDKVFEFSTEDFTGSANTDQTVVLLGDDRGPYTLRDYLQPEVNSITLKNQERATILVNITVPKDAEPGGRYGSVLVRTVSTSGEKNKQVAGSAPLVTRIGVLFFVRVPGDVDEVGSMKEFTLKGGSFILSDSKQHLFRILFQNTGSVHLNPYGSITVENIFGEPIGEVEIEPWFVLPGATRLREVEWDHAFLFGRYTAYAKIHRGYNDMVDEMAFTFWVLPWKIMSGTFISIVLLLLCIRWLLTTFKIQRRIE